MFVDVFDGYYFVIDCYEDVIEYYGFVLVDVMVGKIVVEDWCDINECGVGVID